MIDRNARRCRHIKTNGIQCGSPAMRDRDFCHFHRQAYLDFPNRRAATPAPAPVISLGLMEDPDGIHYALTHVIYGLFNGTIDRKTAGTATYMLQTMSSNFKQTSFHRQKEDEYRKSNLNAYQLWDKINQECEDRDRTRLHEKRVEELKKLERTCCKCKKQSDDPAALTPPIPTTTTGVPHPSPSGEGAPIKEKERWEIKACAEEPKQSVDPVIGSSGETKALNSKDAKERSEPTERRGRVAHATASGSPAVRFLGSRSPDSLNHRSADHPMSCGVPPLLRPLITDYGVIQHPIEELLDELQQFEFAQ